MSSRPSLSNIPYELVLRIYDIVADDYRTQIRSWSNDPLPAELKTLASINATFRSIVRSKQFANLKFSNGNLEQFAQLGALIEKDYKLARYLGFLSLSAQTGDIAGWYNILSIIAEGEVNLEYLQYQNKYDADFENTIQTSDDADPALRIQEERGAPMLQTKILRIIPHVDEARPKQEHDFNQEMTPNAVKRFFKRFQRVDRIELGISDMRHSRSVRRKNYKATCENITTIINMLPDRFDRLTQLRLDTVMFMGRLPISSSTRAFYYDEHVDTQGDRLSTLLRQISKHLQHIEIYNLRIADNIWGPLHGETLTESETENWPELRVFRLEFDDINAAGYRWTDKSSDGEENDIDVEDQSDVDDGHDQPPLGDADFDFMDIEVEDAHFNGNTRNPRSIPTQDMRVFFIRASNAATQKMPKVEQFRVVNATNPAMFTLIFNRVWKGQSILNIGERLLGGGKQPGDSGHYAGPIINPWKERYGEHLRVNLIEW